MNYCTNNLSFFLKCVIINLNLKIGTYLHSVTQVKLNLEMEKKAINHFLFSYYILINFLKKISGEGEGNTFFKHET